MPVSFPVADHPAAAVQVEEELTAEKLLDDVTMQTNAAAKILQFALGVGQYGHDFTKFTHLIPDRNGFVNTVTKAYNNHHALVIRPDDVWLTILCQFHFFINANAELLRANFVSHEGRQQLVVAEVDTRDTVDFGKMARQMVDLVDKNVCDPTLRPWALPAFTTTTANDTAVAAILLLATLKEYLSYNFLHTRCGIPHVTLEGEKADWVDILGRLEKLKEYGLQTTAWYHLLRPVIARLVVAFDAPDSEENLFFWSKVVKYHSVSGGSYYSGWINAFNVFSPQGKWLGRELDLDLDLDAVPNVKEDPYTDAVPDVEPSLTETPEAKSARIFWTKYAKPEKPIPLLLDKTPGLVLDGTPYHRLLIRKVPPCFAEIPVTIVEHSGEKSDCAMLAGMVGTQVVSSGDKVLSDEGKDDTVRPVAGWWMYVKNVDGDK
ncbi:hypothetical protein MVEN_02183300 [Mycena venus]|uniref:DUF4419 domain-containing protein n=1 Tax=Mycena venus TaxID=2733690 RepID=A0A8H6X868_9AGAR|nr:hypothetical protein MVEN_02183300 [Mycena venus]